MSKQKKDLVWELVQVLTKAEKRQFKLYAQRMERNENSKFIALFDLLNKSDCYDEVKILEKKIVTKNQLSNLKSHLYKQILTSLRMHAASNSIKLQLRDQVDSALVLYNKGLYLHALKILGRAKALASKNEYLTVLFEIIDFEKVIESQFITRSKSDRADELCAQSNEVITKISVISKLSNASLQLYNFLLQFGYVKNESEKKQIDQLFEANVNPGENLANFSFLEKLWFYKANLWYYFIIQHYDKAYEYASLWAEMFEANPLMKINHPIFYLKGNHYLMEVLFYLWNIEKHSAVLDNLLLNIAHENLTLNGNSETLAFLYTRSNQLNEAMLTFSYEKGALLIKRIVKELPEFKNRLDEHHIILFYYKFACIYFGLENYEKCNQYLDCLIKNKNIRIGKNLMCNAMFLSIFSNYDKGDFEAFEKALNTAYKYLSQANNLNEVYVKIMHFIKKISKAYPHEIKPMFTQLRDELLPYTNHPYERRTFLYLDIISWLDSKIVGKPMVVVMMEKRLEI